MKIVPDKKYPNMYRIQWPNGDISISTPSPDKPGGHYGFYSKTRAKELLRREDIKNYTLDKTYNSPMAR
jgi:hypothetical protein